MDRVRIEGLELACVVGVHPAERRVEQRVVLDLELELDTRPAARSGRIALTADYDVVARQAEALLRFRRYVLVETACDELAAVLLAAHAPLARVGVTLHKPSALPGRARAASVVTWRSRAELGVAELEVGPWGRRELVLETSSARVLREVLAGEPPLEPGARGRRELVLVTAGRVTLGSRRLATGESAPWEGAGSILPAGGSAELLRVAEVAPA
ncbi:MAG: dihydroneopterin aldolase [Polyangiaceae bacterium]|nr:dihydroneopterin aldolase [Polyangiaceae bacterium]